jgi:hypothetical protein
MEGSAGIDSWLEENEARTGESDGLLVEQALALFERAGVHLPDRLSRGIDPVSRLLDLAARRPGSRIGFYRELLAIFAEFGDRHSRCILPRPWSNRYAFLPITVGACFEDGERRLLVTSSAVGALRRGDALLSWNGRSPGEIIRTHALWRPGANDEARFAMAVQTLTVRPLGLTPAPVGDVELAAIGPDGRERRVVMAWRVGNDACLDRELSVCKPSAQDFELSPAGFMERRIRAGSREIGWIKIPSLRVPSQPFLTAFAEALERQPREGLVLDLRGCEEGFVETGEQLLQLLTDKRIETLRFQFRITDWVKKLVRTCPALASWRAAIDRAVALDQAFSTGQPLTSPEAANAVGRKYRGPVVLVVDALTYSTAEMFAAGVQDHDIGLVIGVAGRTGGGGGSPWSQDLIHRLSGDELFARAPGSASIQMAVRRCHRVGRNSGRLLEGNGVVPDVIHDLTRRDILDADADLAECAARLLLSPR